MRNEVQGASSSSSSKKKKKNSGSSLGELPILGNLSTSSGRVHNTMSSSRGAAGKCSSSRSLYYADGFEFEGSSSRQDLRRSASALYYTVDCEFEPSSRSSRREEVAVNRSSKNATTLAAGCSSSSSVLGSRRISAGWSFRLHREELPAATGEEELPAEMCRKNKKKKSQEVRQYGKHERPVGEDQRTFDRATWERSSWRQRLQLLQDDDDDDQDSENYSALKNVHKKNHISQSCRMQEIGDQIVLQSRGSSPPRHGSSSGVEAVVVHRKLRSLGSIVAMGYDEVGFLLPSAADESTKTIATAAAALHESGPGLQQRAAAGGQRRKLAENCCSCKKPRERSTQRCKSNKKLEEAAAIALSGSGELEVMAFVAGERDFARSSRRSQLGASFTMQDSGAHGSRAHAGMGYMTSPSPDHSPSHVTTVAVPFNWEEAPGKPKTMQEATILAVEQIKALKAARSLSRDQGMEASVLFRSAAAGATSMDLGSSSELEPESPGVLLKSRRNSEVDQIRAAVGERSHRYYNQFAMEKSFESRSSRSLQQVSQEQETRSGIDLVAAAAAKFLVQETSCYLSPLATPLHDHAFTSPGAGAVPFKWEETPGKPKLADAAAAFMKPHCSSLQLPPRLAIPVQQRAADICSGSGSSRFSTREVRAQYYNLTSLHPSSSLSGPLAGFFTPCLMSACSSPPQQQNAAAVLQPVPQSILRSQAGSKSLPRKLSSSSTLAGISNNSIPSGEDQHCVKKTDSSKRSAFSAPLVTTSPAGNLQPRRLYSSELCKASHPACIDKVKSTGAGASSVHGLAGATSSFMFAHATAAAAMRINSSSPSSTDQLHAPDSTAILSQTLSSSSHPSPSLSGYLDALAQTASTVPSATSSPSELHVGSKSSRSQASYLSFEQEELGHVVEPPTISPIKCNNLHPHDAAALEMLSPGVNLMEQQHKRCNGECSSSGKRSKASSSSSSSSPSSSARSTSRWTGPKIRHRVRFIVSSPTVHLLHSLSPQLNPFLSFMFNLLVID